MFKIFLGCYYLIVAYTVAAYEYGYHSSSEEVGGPLRVKSWTRDLLWQERNVKKFTPRFNLEKPKDVASEANFGEYPFVNSASENNEKFTGYADSDMLTLSSENVPAVSKDSFVNKLEIPANHTVMPIFFTNPATGIVYAITEVGVNKNETRLPEKGTIPIFVSKEQYDRDLYLLKRSYEAKCLRQGRPQIIKLDGGSFVNNAVDSVLVKTDLNFAKNNTRFNRGKKRKNPHRKAKKHKSSQKKQPVQNVSGNSSFPIEVASTLDTQLEKPNKVNLTSVFSSNQSKPPSRRLRLNSTLVKRAPHIAHKPPKVKVHVVSKRSINSTDLEKLNGATSIYTKSTMGSQNFSELGHNNKVYIVTPTYPRITTRSLNSTDIVHNEVTPSPLELTMESAVNEKVTLTKSFNATEPQVIVTAMPSKFTTRSLNASDSEKSKKILSTQIQVTSEYLEPTTQTRTPKNSNEVVTHSNNLVPPKSQNPPCKEAKPKKPQIHDEYDDYYDFGGPSYNDYPSSNSDSEAADDSSEASNGVSSLENSISDYNSLEGTTQQDGNYRLRKTTKKRIKRRRPYSDEYNDYDDDYDDESNDGMMGLIRGLFTPVQWIMDRIFDKAGHMFDETPEPENNDNRKPKYPQYTVYNSGANGVADSEETDGYQGNSLSSWFGSWFGFRKRRDGVSTTPASLDDEPGWFESWFGYDVRTPSPNEEESDPWFFGWFNGEPRPKRTTTTTTTTPVPILTIAEPLKNPHKWIGILAQHIINSTSTNNPLIETTTDNPDIPKKVSYNKYQIWRLKPNDDTQVKVLEEYKRGEEGVRLQWLKGPTLRGLTDVLIPPKMLTDFQGTLNFENIAHETLIFDVGKVISYEQAKQDDVPAVKPGPGKPIMSWNRYYDYDSIIKYLELIQVRNPQFVELIHIGRSYEGRPLVIAKVEANKPNDKLTKKKKLKLSKKTDQANGVFIEAGIHGREWIAPASATWMINELLKIMKNNRTTVETEYIKNTTWYIMPVSNPDSYEYSHQYDRLWKKSRSRHIAKPNGIINSAMTWLQKKKSEKVCFGVDLDCNWHYNWGRKGSSKSPCNEFFAGPTPFSEPESKAISKFLMDNRKQIRLFVSLQAYGQIISYPNKLNSSFQSQKLDDLLDVAMVGTDGLRRKGSKSRYKVDSTNDLIETKSGSSDYFATFEVGIPFSYTIHLADNGVHGFLLPSTYIEPTAKDAFEIITAMIDYI